MVGRASDVGMTVRVLFERLCETGVLSAQQRQDLDTVYRETNPLQLREEIYALIDHLFSLSNAVPGVTENVYELVGLLREERQLTLGNIIF